MNPKHRFSIPLLYGLFLVSGATALLYEVMWLRQLVLIFGSTLFATSTVLSTFMGGLALGAYGAGRILRTRAISPLKLYGFLEIGIGLYAVAVPFLFRQLSPIYRLVWEAGGADSFFVMSLAKFAGIAVVLLPPTALMGASLPVLARQVADDPRRIGGKVGTLYAVNTFGAVLGVFLGGFFAIPSLGVHRTLVCTAIANVLVGIAAVAFAPRSPLGAGGGKKAPSSTGGSRESRIPLVAFGLSGFGAMVLEVAWTRGLALVMGSSVYAFALMLLAFLIGLAAGSAAFSVLLRRRPDLEPRTLLAILLASAGALSFVTTYLMQILPRLFAAAYVRFEPTSSGMFALEFFLGLLVMFPPTFALGGIFPAVLQIHARGVENVPGSVGTVYASNTLGTILGAFAGGFLLIPLLGVRDTLVLVSALEIGLGLLVAWTIPYRGGRMALATPMALAILLLPVVRPGWDKLVMNSGVYYYMQDVQESGWEEFARQLHDDCEIVYMKEGLTSTVLVVDQPKYQNRYLTVNGKVEASSTADVETQILCSHLPLLFHEAPKDVLIIGLASGITVGAAATHPVKSLRVVEVEKAIVGAARLFSEHNRNVLDDPRLTLSINDARNELEFSGRQYDVIVSEPSNPFMTVAANLFTEDFFALAKTRVRPGGIFSQWVQAYCMPPDDLRSVIAAFRSAFPKVLLFQVGGIDLIMMGSDRPLRFDVARMRERMSELGVFMDLGRVGIEEPTDFFPLFQLGDDEIDRLVKGAPRNTDDNARVEYSAPKAIALHTVTLNWDMLEEYSGTPLDYLTPPLETSDEEGRMTLVFAEAWLRRGDAEAAAGYARQALDGPRAEEARSFLARINAPEAPP